MLLPKEVQNSQSGQILIIFLLILVVGLAIVLSIASRTVTDVRQTTTSDESNRAYFAAESGVENALKKIQDGTITPTGTPNTSAGLDLSSVNRTNADVSVISLSVTGVAFEFPNKVAKDDVAQVNLMDNFNDLATANVGAKSVRSNEQLVIYWSASPPSEAAIEVSVITCLAAGATCPANPTFNIHKFTFDANAASHGNNFCSSGLGGAVSIATTEGTNRAFARSAVVRFIGGTCGGINDSFPSVSYFPVMARIRTLYNSSPISIAVQAQTTAPANKDLPDQGSKITSIGKTPSGVTRKLTVTRLYPALPAIFDYVLYNGSSTQALTKP